MVKKLSYYWHFVFIDENYFPLLDEPTNHLDINGMNNLIVAYEKQVNNKY